MIPDRLAVGLKVLFIGYNPSLRSDEVGHHYAGKNNRFWKLLDDSRITERRMRPMEDHQLLQLGIGFTNIVARPTRRADEITKHEFAEGREVLLAKLQRFTPQVACFVGKGVYEHFARQKNIPWGLQSHSIVSGVLDFVAPSSSGLVRMPYAEILAIYKELKNLIG